MQISRSIYRLPVSTPTLFPATTTNVYIIKHREAALLIDAGYDDPQATNTIINFLDSHEIHRIEGIVLTHHHPDHSPGAKTMADIYKCPILCHPLEVKLIEQKIAPLRVTDTLVEGDTLQIGDIELRILHTPGHTHGHINLWIEKEKLLFSGDNIVAEGTTWIGPPDGDLIQYLTTLNRLLALKPHRIAPGHGSVIDNPMEKIQFFIQRRLEREQQILGLLRMNSATVSQLIHSIYQDQIHPSVRWAAERTVLGHLEKLLQEEKITCHKENHQELYSIV